MRDSKEKRIGDFLDHGDGTASDTRTGLMWMRCALGQSWDGNACIGKPSFYNLDEVSLPIEFAGYSDWRLPINQEFQFARTPTLPSLTVDEVFTNKEYVRLVRDRVWWGAGGVQAEYKLVIHLIGAGGGIVSQSPKLLTHLQGSTVKLSALPVKGYKFIGWHGDAAGGDVTCEVVMDSAKNIFAEFAPLDLFPLTLESQQQPVEISMTLTHVLQRLLALERNLASVQRQLQAIAGNFQNLSGNAVNDVVPVQTLPEVLQWLVTKSRVSLAELRARLLPLNFLSGAIINDVNERALDLTGDLALEEIGTEVLVAQSMLTVVLANWNTNTELS
jgi:hypothetical protein